MPAIDAKKLRLVDDTVADLASIAERWKIEKIPEPRRIGRLERWINGIANQEWLATLLLILAFVLLTTELTTPGLSIAGFLSMVCLILFFWLKFLNGTVEWLEVVFPRRCTRAWT